MKRSMGQWRGGLRGSACQLEHAKRRELVGPGGMPHPRLINRLAVSNQLNLLTER